MTAKKAAMMKRIDAVKKELLIRGVPGKKIEEAIEAAMANYDDRKIKGCPTMVSKTLGRMLEDGKISSVSVHVNDLKTEIRMQAWDGSGAKVGQAHEFKKGNWSTKASQKSRAK